MKNRKIIIANSCRMGFTEGAVRFSTKTGNSKYFNLPHDSIIDRNVVGIKQDDHNEEPAVEYEITAYMFNRIKGELEIMDSKNCIIMPENHE